MDQFVVQTQKLRKTFTSRQFGGTRSVDAVAGVDLAVRSGEIFGLLGPNGAGKTTLLRILCTLLAPTGGIASVTGFDLATQEPEIRKHIGYVGQKGGMEREATGRENLLLQAKLYGMSDAEAASRVDDLIARLGLSEFANRQTSQYSGGQRRIFDLAAGVVQKPLLMFLDEPTTGLDPASRNRVWEEVKLLRKSGTTIVLTTHYLEEADVLCDRVAIMDAGKIVSLGKPEDLKRQILNDTITLSFENAVKMKKAYEALAGSNFIAVLDMSDNELRLGVANGSKNLPRIIKLLDDKEIPAISIQLKKPSLDDVFLKLTGHAIEQSPEKENHEL